MTDSAWSPLVEEDVEGETIAEEVRPVAPHYTILTLPMQIWGQIPSINFVNFYPTAEARRPQPRTRQTVLLLAVNPDTGMVPVVQPADASSGQWSLIQGRVRHHETAYDAVCREAFQEATLTIKDVVYVGSYRAPVDGASEKRAEFDEQLFHCYVARTDSVQAEVRSVGVAVATFFHQSVVLKTLLESASPVKRDLLPHLFKAAVASELLPSPCCKA